MPRWPLEARGTMAACGARHDGRLRRARAGIIPASRPPVACKARPTPMVATTKPLIEPNAQNHYDIRPDDLPPSCPMPPAYLWTTDPRESLAGDAGGWAKGQYCGAEDALKRGRGRGT